MAKKADLESSRRLKHMLQRTWYAFFARFPRPTLVQAMAAGPIMDGRDVLLCSPSASGKTEAFLAPLVERYLPTGARPAVTVAIVSPTRALVNDLYRRITPPLERLGVSAARRTGDRKDTSLNRPCQVLVTTPESLDSVLARQASMLARLKALVLDEIHVLDSTARGDQARVLVQRLRAMLARRKIDLQVVVSSATVQGPEELAGRYLERPECVVVDDEREMETTFADTPTPFSFLDTLAYFLGREARKILVFLKRRAEVEFMAGLASASRLLGNRIYCHHGSLSRAERERIEARFLDDPSAVCFATTTLELGIDIGDVDLVAIVGSAGTVASLVQRTGRGNRRTGRCRLLACSRTRGEELVLRHQVAMAEKGRLDAFKYVFNPVVLPQQAGSMLMQSVSGWIAPEVLESRLPADVAEKYPAARLETMFEKMVDKGWFKRGFAGRYVPGERLARAMDIGTLHSNLDSEAGGIEVVEESTGRSLGYVGIEPKREVAIGGKGRKVVASSQSRILVKQISDVAASPEFRVRSGVLVSRWMARSLGEWLGVEPGTVPVIRIGKDTTAVFHFQGSFAGKVLAYCIDAMGAWKVVDGGPYYMVVQGLPDNEKPFLVTAQAMAETVVQKASSLKNMLSLGPFAGLVPKDWMDDFLVEKAECSDVAAQWSESVLKEIDDKDLAHKLTVLAEEWEPAPWKGPPEEEWD